MFRIPFVQVLGSCGAVAHAVAALLPAQAQTQVQMQHLAELGPSLHYQTSDRSWPPNVGGAPRFEKIVDADLDGDLVRDAVVLAGGVPVLAAGPAVFTSFTDLISGGYQVRDLDRLPRGGPQGSDGLVVLEARGLASIAFDGSGFVVTMISEASAWLQATRVVALDLSSAVMLLGLAADGVTVVSTLDNGGGWVRGPSFVATDPIVDIDGCDLDADGTPEIVLATAQALEPFELRGTAGTPIPALGTTLAIAVLPGAGAAGDRIAWITENATGRKQLTVVGPSGVETPQVLAFPLDESGLPIDFELVGVAAGDVDRDGDHDLVLGQKTALFAIVLLDIGATSGTGSTFAPQEPGAVKLLPLAAHPYVSVPANDCPPSCADYDRDGFADVLSARDDAQLLNLQQGVDLFGFVFLGNPGISAEDIVHGFQDFDPNPLAGALHLVLHLPADYREAFDYLELTVWRQEQPYALVASQAPAHVIHRIVKTAGAPVAEHQWLTIGGPGLFPPGPTWPGVDHFYVVLRFVDLVDGQVNKIADASPSFAFGMTLQPAPGATSWDDYLKGLPDAGGTASLNSGGGPPGTSGGRTLVGAVVIQRVLPPMSIILPPQPGPTSPVVQPMSTWNPLLYW